MSSTRSLFSDNARRFSQSERALYENFSIICVKKLLHFALKSCRIFGGCYYILHHYYILRRNNDLERSRHKNWPDETLDQNNAQVRQITE